MPALAAFTTPGSGGLDHARQIPELTAGDTGDHRLVGDHSRPLTQKWLASER